MFLWGRDPGSYPPPVRWLDLPGGNDNPALSHSSVHGNVNTRVKCVTGWQPGECTRGSWCDVDRSATGWHAVICSSALAAISASQPLYLATVELCPTLTVLCGGGTGAYLWWHLRGPGLALHTVSQPGEPRRTQVTIISLLMAPAAAIETCPVADRKRKSDLSSDSRSDCSLNFWRYLKLCKCGRRLCEWVD